MTEDRYVEAVAMVEAAEAAVRRAEENLAAATDPTERDVLESDLQQTIALEDEVLVAVLPAIAARDRAVREAVREALRDPSDPKFDWTKRHRRHMPPAVKAVFVRRLGRRTFERAFPW